MQFIIFDLEATCWNGNALGKQQEVIEIGAVRLNALGEHLDSFQCYIRPKMNPRLSAYCMELTGIQQRSVDRAYSFERVVDQFQHWIEDVDEDYLLCAWGEKDIPLLENDSHIYDLETEWMYPNIDMKRQYQIINSLSKRIGLMHALEKEGIEFEGEHHSAYYDALNTSRLFVTYLDEWKY